MSAVEKPTTVVSTKGQVILPKAIRQRRRWDAGTRLVSRTHPTVCCSGPRRRFR
jgi:AbrB family looped-hinge helix DNA binding protein